MKILRTIIILVSLLLITSLVNVKEVRAEEVKKDNSNSSVNKKQNKQIATEYKSELVNKIIKTYKLDPKNNPKDQCKLMNTLSLISSHLSNKEHYEKRGKSMPNIYYEGRFSDQRDATNSDQVEKEIEKIKKDTDTSKISVSCNTCSKENYGCNGSFIYGVSDMFPNSACPINNEIFTKRFAAYSGVISPDITTPGDVTSFDYMVTLMFDKSNNGIGYIYSSEDVEESIDYNKERFYSLQKSSKRNLHIVDKNNPNVDLITKGCYITYISNKLLPSN